MRDSEVADVLTKEQRRKCMSSVRGVNTGPEVILRKALWREGVRYSLRSKLPGKPDIVLSRYRIAIFVDGCFWHRCPEHGSLPKTNKQFWEKKIARNVERDEEVNALLEHSRWLVIRVWEHEIKQSLDKVVKHILYIIEQSEQLRSLL